MIKEINGISVHLEDDYEAKNADEIVIGIEYFDEDHLNELINLDLLKVDVKNYGMNWIYVVKSIPLNEYKERKNEVGEVIKYVHSQIISFLNLD
uniref:hypothetical protein n=1 Tax=Radiobacillus sp. PE A8.2 TaxID=3380349 RepID=UPI00388FD449